jgi:hypothetical protein
MGNGLSWAMAVAEAASDGHGFPFSPLMTRSHLSR